MDLNTFLKYNGKYSSEITDYHKSWKLLEDVPFSPLLLVTKINPYIWND
jgi:hypothetical protein